MTDGEIGLVISDVDGTLVNHDKRVSAATVDAVRRLRAAGCPFTLISARPPSGVLPLVSLLDLQGPVAAFNGGTIVKPDGVVVERHVIEREVVEGMFALMADQPVVRWLFASGRWHADSVQGEHVAKERIASAQEPVVTSDFGQLYGDADKLTFVSDDRALLAGLAQEAKQRFGARASVGQSQTYYLDVTDLAANKGAGVEALAAAFRVPLARTAVLGDMDNDVPMFERAALAIAMGQAPEPVKAKARFVSTSNDDDGVARAIDRFVLPRIGAARDQGAQA